MFMSSRSCSLGSSKDRRELGGVTTPPGSERSEGGLRGFMLLRQRSQSGGNTAFRDSVAAPLSVAPQTQCSLLELARACARARVELFGFQQCNRVNNFSFFFFASFPAKHKNMNI